MADNVQFSTNFLNFKSIDLQNGRASRTFNYSNVISYRLLKKVITQKIGQKVHIVGHDGLSQKALSKALIIFNIDGATVGTEFIFVKLHPVLPTN